MPSNPGIPHVDAFAKYAVAILNGYSVSATTERKLPQQRMAVTGEQRQPKHKGRRPGVKNGANPPTRLVASLKTVCEREGMPGVHGFEQLPFGEQRIMKSLGVIDFVKQIGSDQRIPRKPRSKKQTADSKNNTAGN